MHKRTYPKKDGRLLYLYGLAPHTLPALEEGENTGQAQSHAPCKSKEQANEEST